MPDGGRLVNLDLEGAAAAAEVHERGGGLRVELPVDERRRVLGLLQAGLPGDKTEAPSSNGGQTSPAAKWLLSMAGRYSGGPGNTAARADEILRAEIGKQRGLKN